MFGGKIFHLVRSVGPRQSARKYKASCLHKSLHIYWAYEFKALANTHTHTNHTALYVRGNKMDLGKEAMIEILFLYLLLT